MKKDIPIGSLRIGVDREVYSWNGGVWKASSNKLDDALEVVKLFEANDKFDLLVDKDKKFLKGILFPDGICSGARITVLPNGDEIDGRYSLFAKNLTVHDEVSNQHWDVLYKNPGGGWAYLYSKNKAKAKVDKKFSKVDEFSNVYDKLLSETLKGLKDKKDFMALPMLTLLKTHIRFGNERYFKLHGHKGLSTLAKKDVKIDGQNVTFEFLGKDGVPIKARAEFPEEYVDRLKINLEKVGGADFIFVNDKDKLLVEKDFKRAFKKYCGKEFYPHIVRSHHATSSAKEFLDDHKEGASKKEVRDLFLSIADSLGHKKFSKKKNEWVDNYTVTVHHYIDGSVVEKIEKLIG